MIGICVKYVARYHEDFTPVLVSSHVQLSLEIRSVRWVNEEYEKPPAVARAMIERA